MAEVLFEEDPVGKSPGKHVDGVIVKGLVGVVFAAVAEMLKDRAIIGVVGFQLNCVDCGSKALEI